jgi:hypothetical protein
MLLALLSGVMATFLAFGALRVLQHMPSTIVFYSNSAVVRRGVVRDVVSRKRAGGCNAVVVPAHRELHRPAG